MPRRARNEPVATLDKRPAEVVRRDSNAVKKDGWHEAFPPCHSYPAGAELLRQGVSPTEVFRLERGLAKLSRLQEDGQEAIVGIRTSGWMLGASAAILGRPYAATATAVTRCSVARLEADQFRQLLRTNTELSWCLHEMHSREVYDELVHVADLSSLSAQRRLEHVLLELAIALGSRRQASEIELEIPLRLWEVAQLIAVTPAYLSGLLSRMERDGVLRRGKGHLTLLRVPDPGAPGLEPQGPW